MQKLPLKSSLTDLSFWFLLLSNAVTIVWALIENWNLSTIMWIYWFQSIIIGFFNFIRILDLKEFSTEGVTINDQPAKPTEGTKYFTAFFFLFHYGFFHFGYFKFLDGKAFEKISGGKTGVEDLNFIYVMAFAFFVSHAFSYLYNKPKDTKNQNIGSVMFYPYARIIPMHFTIMFGSFIGAALPLFLVLKAVADGMMHHVEHNVLRKGEEPPG